MREQRTREEIVAAMKQIQVGSMLSDQITLAEQLQIELLADCRDLLQKLVEKGQKTKVITTEVPFTEKEEELFNGLSKLDV